MPTAPFGLAYGLGAGMAIAPQQMFTRQEQGNQLAMQGLQQQLLQHQVAQQQAEDQAFSQPIAPQMQSITQTQPGFESALAANQTLGGMKGLGGEDLTLAAPTQTVQKPVEYTTPYEKMAYEYGQRADKLARMGFGRSAMALQQQAAQYGQMHQNMALSQAARMASIGNYGDATKMLNGLGMNITGMDQSQDDPDTVQIHSTQNGQPVVADIPKQFLGAMIEDPAKAAQSIGMLNWRMATIGSREQIAREQMASREKQTAQRVEAQKANWASRNATQQVVAQIRASAPSSEAKTVAAEARNVLAQNPDMSPEEAEATVWAQHRLEKGGSDPKLRAAINATTHISPYTQDPTERETLTNARNYINGILGKKPETQTGAQSREKIATIGAQQKELDRQNRLQIAQIRASTPAGLRGSTTTADERKVEALMRDTGIGAEEAWNRVRPDIASRGQVTDKDRLHVLTARNAEIRKNLGGAPTRDDPEYQEYLDNQNTIQGLMRGGKKSAPTSTPVVDVASERSMAAAALAAHPEAADRIKSAFKAKTGQDY